jgi:large subunit ribosomal protein L11
MSRALKGNARLYLDSCKAKPGPKVGQALGPLGLNMMEVCRSFNALTTQAGFRPDIPLRVYVSAYEDRTFDMKFKSPSTTYFFFKCAGIEKGSGNPGTDFVGKIDLRQIYHIALTKQKIDPELQKISLKGVCKSLVGSAHSMGLDVINPIEEYELLETDDLNDDDCSDISEDDNLPINEETLAKADEDYLWQDDWDHQEMYVRIQRKLKTLRKQEDDIMSAIAEMKAEVEVEEVDDEDDENTKDLDEFELEITPAILIAELENEDVIKKIEAREELYMDQEVSDAATGNDSNDDGFSTPEDDRKIEPVDNFKVRVAKSGVIMPKKKLKPEYYEHLKADGLDLSKINPNYTMKDWIRDNLDYDVNSPDYPKFEKEFAKAVIRDIVPKYKESWLKEMAAHRAKVKEKIRKLHEEKLEAKRKRKEEERAARLAAGESEEKPKKKLIRRKVEPEKNVRKEVKSPEEILRLQKEIIKAKEEKLKADREKKMAEAAAKQGVQAKKPSKKPNHKKR